MGKLSLSILLGVLLFAQPLGAAGGNATKYPLRIQVNKADYGCTNCDNIPPVLSNVLDGPAADPDKHYAGRGRAAILLDANKTQAFYFAYDGCLDPLPLSVANSLAARWKKPGKELEVLVPAYSPHKPVNFATKKLSKCEVDYSLKPIPVSKSDDRRVQYRQW